MSAVRRRYGGSTFSFMWREPAAAALAQMRRLGMNDFDLILAPGHLWHDDMPPGKRATWTSRLKAEDIRIESLNLPALDLNLSSCLPAVRAHAVALYRQTLQLSAELGARGVVVVPGRVSALLPPPQGDSEAWLAEGLHPLLDEAAALGQFIHLETHPQTPLPTADRLEAFLDRLPHPRLKVAYDVANAEFVGEDQVAAIRRLAPRLGQVHLSDGTRSQWRHDAVGRGTVRFQAIEAVLDEVGFYGVRILEVISPTPIDDLRSSLAALAAISPASP